jgi:hypothetical protein
MQSDLTGQVLDVRRHDGVQPGGDGGRVEIVPDASTAGS